MSLSDPIANMITSMRNAHARFKPFVDVPASRHKNDILSVLKREGYIKSFELIGELPSEKKIRIYLKYYNGRPVIRCIERASKPSVQYYVSCKKITPISNGLGTSVLSTSRGVLSDSEALSQGVGGKIIIRVS